MDNKEGEQRTQRRANNSKDGVQYNLHALALDGVQQKGWTTKRAKKQQR